MKTLLLITLLSLTIISINTQAADEGIKVHGHWKFEIYNPDGSFDRKVEFENALNQSVGQQILLKMMNKSASILEWKILLSSPYQACSLNNGTISTGCAIHGIGSNIVDPQHATFYTLSFGLDDDTSPSKLILSGTVTVNPIVSNPTITSVSTWTFVCEPATTTCNNYYEGVFTEKNLLNPIPVSAGQIVQVTVEISFS